MRGGDAAGHLGRWGRRSQLEFDDQGRDPGRMICRPRGPGRRGTVSRATVGPGSLIMAEGG